jgi:membrane protease YdiL (CAAX protease family)
MIHDMTTPRRPMLALILLVPVPTLGVLCAMAWFPGVAGQAAWAVSKAWLVALPLVWLIGVDKGALSVSPIPRDRRRGAVIAGMVSGAAIFALIVGGYAVLGRSWIDVDAVRAHMIEVGLDRRWLYLGAAAYWVCVNSVIEEYVWRWFVYTRLAALMPPGKFPGAAVVVAGLAFTLHHVIALGFSFQWDGRVVALASVGVFVGGVTWSVLYAKFGSIWPGWISHAWADGDYWVSFRVVECCWVASTAALATPGAFRPAPSMSTSTLCWSWVRSTRAEPFLDVPSFWSSPNPR